MLDISRTQLFILGSDDQLAIGTISSILRKLWWRTLLSDPIKDFDPQLLKCLFLRWFSRANPWKRLVLQFADTIWGFVNFSLAPEGMELPLWFRDSEFDKHLAADHRGLSNALSALIADLPCSGLKVYDLFVMEVLVSRGCWWGRNAACRTTVRFYSGTYSCFWLVPQIKATKHETTSSVWIRSGNVVIETTFFDGAGLKMPIMWRSKAEVIVMFCDRRLSHHDPKGFGLGISLQVALVSTWPVSVHKFCR